ncbi:hypothetical protein MFU01_40500 [Myxococcus fulvus]|uniref:Uncharacterized protein n=1 Tax=Myxococcus fulvus TaxID=33 RepID=A0A511T5X7_MYXFU|nr:hypothetical protein MFU01_40500 [Myxococcus fulvus]
MPTEGTVPAMGALSRGPVRMPAWSMRCWAEPGPRRITMGPTAEGAHPASAPRARAKNSVRLGRAGGAMARHKATR